MWKDVPENDRLEFKVIDQPLSSVAEAMINKIDREWPERLRAVEGARTLFLLLARIALTTYQTIKYLCAENPQDPFRKVEFSLSTPPLLRSMLDEIFTVVFIAEALPERVSTYLKAGWREVAERDRIYRQRYANDPAWSDWLTRQAMLVSKLRRDSGVADEEAANPKSLRWPTPGRMKPKCQTSTKDFFEYLDAWFYRELSQGTHLSWPGLSYRGAPLLLREDDPHREAQLFKMRSDSVAFAVVFLLAFITEVNFALGFDLGPRCAYIWGILGKYFGAADELYSVRYRAMLGA